MASFIPQVTDTFPDPATFTPDFSFLDRMLRRRQMAYEQGYGQIASNYQSIAREVTNGQNAQLRDQFLKEAQNNLKDLSSMDLSQQQNVQAASSVFAPFYKNTNILGDQALTAHWNQQESIAESYRLKDGGKEYSDDNINYVRMQKQQFANSDPSDWKSFYASKRYYTPYYNYHDEIVKAMENFKPSSTVMDYKNGMYINHVQDKSWYKEELSKYLSGTLSDKAKQQMGIEASVRLSSDPQQLASAYIQEAGRSAPILGQQIAKLDQQIKLSKNPQEIAQLNMDKQYYQDKLQEISGHVQAIQKGDMTYLQANKDRLAQQLYMSDKMNGYISAYAHKDIDQSIKFDEVAMMIYRENEALKRAVLHEDREDARKKMEQQSKYGPLMQVSTPGEEFNMQTQSMLISDLDSARKQMEGKHQEVIDHIATVMGISRDKVTEDTIKQFSNSHPKDDVLGEYTRMGTNVQDKQAALDDFHSNAEMYAKSVLGDDNYQKLKTFQKTIGNLEVNNPNNNFEKIDLKSNILNGGLNRGDISSFSPVRGLNQKVQYSIHQTALNNAEKQLGLYEGEGRSLLEQYNKAIQKYNTDPSTHHLTVNRQGFQLIDTDPRYKLTTNRLQQVSGIDKEKIKSVVYVPTPSGLDIHFSYEDNAKNPTIDPKQALTLLKTKFANSNIKYNEDTKTFTIKGSGSVIEPDLDPYSVVDPLFKDKLQQLESSLNKPGSARESSFIVKDNSGRNLAFKIRKTYGTTTEGDGYYLYGDGTKEPLYPMKFRNALAPYKVMMALLTDTPENIDALMNSKK